MKPHFEQRSSYVNLSRGVFVHLKKIVNDAFQEMVS